MNYSGYKYRDRKKEVEKILDNTNEVKEVTKFPSEDNFTYTNGYKAFASAIFVDLRDSTSLFSNDDEVKIAKVIRGFTSEIIEILRKDVGVCLKEIGIRGDCVFAVYSTSTKEEVYDLANRAFIINTYMKMLNKLLNERELPNIKAGIGLAVEKTLAVKAGRHSSGINNLVWIGESVAKAAKLSDLGNKDGVSPIVMSDVFYENYISEELKVNPDVEKYFTKKLDTNYGTYYHANLVKTEFNDWIEEGMPE